ncbi:7-cyano-7-deazaguanine synthase QueC [Herbaspirillum rhizosphaerae]|uniref:7-cyano-7-deazaguanine synthase QueC n=1 Tax=Herbaspirillum rhizosphaerae TaxID=346179 RepID=UPI0009F82CBD|nr:7-cyano-7-deazaguanine synthase QueC [Herbaspirillum rhizosphaerae]
MNKKALVLFSGGQDSTTCLAWALSRYDYVETIGFDYGQRHNIELEVRLKTIQEIREKFPEWGSKLGNDHLIDLSVLGEISDTALTSDAEIAMTASGLPNTFVPGRNLMFLTFAGAVAYRRGLQVLVGGMCETDFSGYPDCRDDTIKATQVSLSLGMAYRITIETPLMWINKMQTWELAKSLGGKRFIDLVIEDTHTCYVGDRAHRHDWGYGCSNCPACDLRRRGYESWRAKDR